MGGRHENLHCLSEMSAVLDCLSEPAILLGKDHKILAANRAYCHEFAGGDNVCGRRCYEVSHHMDKPCDLLGETCPVHKCQKTAEPYRALHVHYSSRGEEHQDVTAYPVKGGHGEVRAFLEIVRGPKVASAVPSRTRLVGRSPAFNRLLALVQRVASTDTTVLFLGESGTGKELVAEATHELSPRADQPFVPVDCSGLTESLFESELFGHERGSFTGACSRTTGLVEAARGGTLFLDEVGDIPLNLQVKLLRVLETGSFRRVGSVEPIRADFRLICATHNDLLAMVESGAFRRDLYFRISAYPVTLPPLRERLEDLPLLVESLLQRINGGTRHEIHPTALKTLYSHSFPGNVRELSNLLERACLLTDGATIMPEHLPACLESRSRFMPPTDEILPLAQVEARYLQWALEQFHGANSTLARKLGLGERTFYRKISRIRKIRLPGRNGNGDRSRPPVNESST